MSLARYWRIKNITVSGSMFEIGDFEFGNASSTNTGATLSANIAPVGTLSALGDTNTSSRCYWSDGSLSTLVITWDFGTAVECQRVRQTKYAESDRQINTCTIEKSSDGTTWTAVDTALSIPKTDTPQGRAAWVWFSGTNTFKVSGEVLDSTGGPVEALIWVLDRATGELIQKATSSPSTGQWSVPTPDANPVVVVRFAAPVVSDFEASPIILAPGVPTQNAELYDYVFPVEVVPEEPAPL